MRAAGSAGRTPGTSGAAAGGALAPAGRAPAPPDVPKGCFQVSPPRPQGSVGAGRMLLPCQEWVACSAPLPARAGGPPMYLLLPSRTPSPWLSPNQGSGALPGPSPSLLEGAPRCVCPAGSRSPCPHPPRAGAQRLPGAATAPAWPRVIDQAAPASVRLLTPLLVCCCTFQDISILTVSKCLSIVVSGLFLFSSCWAPSLLA